MAAASHTIIPAVAGWELGTYQNTPPDGDPGFRYEPIVAWEIRREERKTPFHHTGRWVSHETIPIVLGVANVNNEDSWVIKRPDGRFEIFGLGTFDSEKEALDTFLEDRPRTPGQEEKEQAVI